MADDTEIVSSRVQSDLKTIENNSEPQNSTLKENVDLKSPENKDCMSPKTTSEPTKEDSPSRASPEPLCSICLGQLQNKSFTDGCYHTFCFACLLEWSKVKAECPLCKVRFKSIVHNVRSIADYDQYYISSRTSSQTHWQSSDPRRRFRYSSTMTSEWLLERRQHRHIRNVQLQSHRSTYAPHTVRSRPSCNYPPVRQESSTSVNISFRKFIYRLNLWAQSPSGRIRESSPTFYQSNSACTHRLIPWLTRELTALLEDNESKVGFILDFILSLILRYHIQSEEFYLHVQSYLGDATSHFVHEFYCFATSPHELEQYDRSVVYDPVTHTSSSYSSRQSDEDHAPFDMFASSISSNIFSSPASEVTLASRNSDDDISGLPQLPFSLSSFHGFRNPTSSMQSRGIRHKPKTVNKLYLKRNQDSNSWNLFSPSFGTSFSSSSPEDLSLPSSSRAFDDPIPSTSGITPTSSNWNPPSVGSENHSIILSSDEENDCVIVQELKPRFMRTPEMVDLIDSSDSEKKINDIEESFDLVSDGSFMSISDMDFDQNPTSSIDKSPNPLNKHHNTPPNDTENRTSSCEKPGSSQRHSKNLRREKNREKHGHSSRKRKSHSSRSRHRTANSRWSSSSRSPSRDRSLLSLWSPWDMESYPQPQSRPVDLSREKKIKSYLVDDSSSSLTYAKAETYTRNIASPDSHNSSEYDPLSPSGKSARLRSVVAQLPMSLHRSHSESSHNSSYSSKKHKDRKKKKKKHYKRRHYKCSSRSKDRRS